jgi:SAM-dependent methyltransferase
MLLKRIKHKFISIFVNNFVVNNLILIPFGKDDFIFRQNYKWEAVKYDNSKSLQQNAGYSDIPEIQKSRDIIHEKLNLFIKEKSVENASVLDIGCGTGLSLQAINLNVKKYGIDLNHEFLEKAQQINPKAMFYHGNFLTFEFKQKFDVIYLLGVFMFIVPSKLDLFFKKAAQLLNDGGCIFILYPPALSFSDIIHHNLSYMRYAPHTIDRAAGKYFNIISNRHAFKDEKVKYIERNPSYYPGDVSKRTDTNWNNYLIVAKKK